MAKPQDPSCVYFRELRRAQIGKDELLSGESVSLEFPNGQMVRLIRLTADK